MRQARALPLPNETLHIEEIRFWLKNMQEHTKFIRAGLPVEAEDFVEAAKEFHRAFTSLMQKSERIKSVKQSSALLREISSVLEEFCHYQRKILAEKLNGKMSGSNFPFFLDHLLREARCFIEFLQRMQAEKSKGDSISYTKEIVVWLRFMSDHTKLIAHYIDPSECRIGKMTADFVDLFDHLVLEARDLSSMLYCHKGEVRAFHRFLLDIRADVQRLRDFHKMAEELIADCRLLGIISVELAAHMKREAEHCLLMIALLEKELIKHCPDNFQDDVDADLWLDTERLEMEPTQIEVAEVTEWADEPVALAVDGTDEVRAEPADEPVVAILPMQFMDEEEKTMEMRSEVLQIEPLPIKTIECAVPPEPEIVSQSIDKKEKVYAKASDAKPMPSKFAGIAPGERYSKHKNHQKLPRALGKAKK